MNEQEQARQLAQVLLARPDPAACEECLDTLDAYIAAQCAGEAYAARWPVVARHLDMCVSCAESYALLYATRLAEERAPAPATIPAPNLSFLPGRAGPPLHTVLAAAVERAGPRLRLALSRALLDLLPSPTAPELALRGTEAGVPLLDLDIDSPGATVERFHVTAYGQEGAPDQCVVRIQLSLQGREWPDLAQIPVALIMGEEQRQALTDPWGEAVFAGVERASLPGLLVEVDAGAIGGPPTST